MWGTRHRREAEQFGADLLGPNRVHVTDPQPGDFYASLHAVRLRDVSLAYLDFTCEARLEVRQLPAAFFVFVPMSGHSTIHTAPDRQPTAETVVEASPIRAVLPRPGMPLLVECNRQAPHLLVIVDQQPLMAHLNRILGRPLDHRLAFDVTFDLSAPNASRWNFAIQMLHAELFEPESLLDLGIGTGQLEEFVMSSLLYAHRSNYTDVLNRPGQGLENRTTRRAKDFVERHLAEPITVGDIADAAGVSERTLQASFKSELATTPMSYVRDRRLDRARADLADAAASDDINVTLVAQRWGFGHLGRFAAEYKSRFGESPSRTLKH